MNMCQLGFRAVCYEGAWSCASLLHVPKQAAPAALREMWRILKPGGMLILSIQEGNTFFQTANLNACWRSKIKDIMYIHSVSHPNLMGY